MTAAARHQVLAALNNIWRKATNPTGEAKRQRGGTRVWLRVCGVEEAALKRRSSTRS